MKVGCDGGSGSLSWEGGVCARELDGGSVTKVGRGYDVVVVVKLEREGDLVESKQQKS